jgi:hypothetical protein
MRLKNRFLLTLCLILSFTVITSCTRDAVEEPSPVGPSGFAISFKVSASPNILFAGFQQRQNTTVTAVLRKFNGEPLTGRTVYFELRDSLGQRADGIGYFEGFGPAASVVTDGNGIVTLNYYGPTTGELRNRESDHDMDTPDPEYDNFSIAAYVAWESSEFIYEYAPIHFVRDFSDLIFNVTVDPNVLWCSNTRPQSTIRAYFAGPDGTPLVGRKIFFEIIGGKGKFSDGKTKTFEETGSDGYATMIYKGPTKNEMSSNEEWVDIQVQPQTWWDEFGDYPNGEPDGDRYYLHVEFRIRLKRAG